MLAVELITDDIPPLKPSDGVKKVIKWMEDLRISHLPIVDKRNFLGLIAYNDLLDLGQPNKTLSQLNLPLVRASVKIGYHLFDVLKLISHYNVSTVAVVDEEEKYIGLITSDSIIRKIAAMPYIHEPGGIIVLEINVRDYSLSQIAQIVEGNGAKILNLFISAQPDSTKMDVTLKINKDDLSSILQTFYRFNYSVKATFQQTNFGNDLRQRYDEFMHFLNI